MKGPKGRRGGEEASPAALWLAAALASATTTRDRARAVARAARAIRGVAGARR